MDTFNRQDSSELRFARMVPLDEIADPKNGFNLNLPRYIDSQTPEDIQDIAGHLQGGVPVRDVDALERYWTVCPNLRKSLFKKCRAEYVALAVEKSAIKSSIFDHAEFKAFVAGMNDHFARWRTLAVKSLRGLKQGCHPKQVIADLSEGLLKHYQSKPLIDAYDVYQLLMNYWAETMQDDCYLIAADSWKAETHRVKMKNAKGKEVDKGWACDLAPKGLIVARYFAQEQAAIDDLAARLEATSAKLAELEEEHGGEEGALSELEKVNKGSVTARLKQIEKEPAAQDEAGVLKDWLKIKTEEDQLRRQLFVAEEKLDAAAYAKYPTLTEAEVQTLVVEDKWLATLDTAIHGEMDRVSQTLTTRVKELAERYEIPLLKLTERVAELEAKVHGHLERMGFAWT